MSDNGSPSTIPAPPQETCPEWTLEQSLEWVEEEVRRTLPHPRYMAAIGSFRSRVYMLLEAVAFLAEQNRNLVLKVAELESRLTVVEVNADFPLR